MANGSLLCNRWTTKSVAAYYPHSENDRPETAADEGSTIQAPGLAHVGVGNHRGAQTARAEPSVERCSEFLGSLQRILLIGISSSCSFKRPSIRLTSRDNLKKSKIQEDHFTIASNLILEISAMAAHEECYMPLEVLQKDPFELFRFHSRSFGAAGAAHRPTSGSSSSGRASARTRSTRLCAGSSPPR